MVAAKRPRNEIRLLVDFPLEVRGERGRFLARARDLTVHGIRVRATTRVRIDERIGLTFRFPGDRLQEPWDLVAYVRWVTDADEAGEMQFGALFDENPVMEKRLRNLVWRLEMGDAKGIERRHKTVRKVVPPKTK